MHKRRLGAKAVEWRWSDYADVDDSARVFHLSERNAQMLLVVVMNQMLWSTRWLDDAPERILAVAELAYRLMTPHDTEQNHPEQKTETIRYIYSVIENAIEEGTEEMRIEKIGNEWYLEVVCGDCGGERLYFPLNMPASVSPTGTVIPSDATTPTPTPTPAPTTESVADCYKEAGAGYMLNRFEKYAHWVIDAVTLGVDLISAIDEGFQTLEFIYESVSNKEVVTDFKSMTKQAVSDLIANQYDDLVAAFPTNAPPSRGELLAWTARAGLTLRVLMNHWLTNSFIAGYGGKLTALASQCASGFVAPYATPEVYGSYTVYKISGPFDTLNGISGAVTPLNWPNVENVGAIVQGYRDSGLRDGVVRIYNESGKFWDFRQTAAFDGLIYASDNTAVWEDVAFLAGLSSYSTKARIASNPGSLGTPGTWSTGTMSFTNPNDGVVQGNYDLLWYIVKNE